MGKPAARMGDSTSHGGIIASGCPTVLLGGMPAARISDNHVCPMVTPGTPPVPHVGGSVTTGSSGVFIGGLPAARAGDSVVCVGQPDSILTGCQTVLIGETASVNSSTQNPGSDNESNGGISTSDAARISTQIAGSGRQETDTHFIEVSFIDNAGLPLSGINYTLKNPDGTVVPGVLPDKLIRRNLPQGSYEITFEDKIQASL